jgi:hypothetical protein
MVEIRVIEAKGDHAPDDVGVRRIAGVEPPELAFEQVQHLRPVGVIFVNRIQNVGSPGASCRRRTRMATLAKPSAPGVRQNDMAQSGGRARLTDMGSI